jgi:hypothetical protein
MGIGGRLLSGELKFENYPLWIQIRKDPQWHYKYTVYS